MKPTKIADRGVTNPAAGVMPTKPATAPVAAPTAVGLPRKAASKINHIKAAAAAAVLVATKAVVAIFVTKFPEVPPETDKALPALKPNQPNQSKPAPNKIKGTLCGGLRRSGWLLRGPRTIAA